MSGPGSWLAALQPPRESISAMKHIVRAAERSGPARLRGVDLLGSRPGDDAAVSRITSRRRRGGAAERVPRALAAPRSGMARALFDVAHDHVAVAPAVSTRRGSRRHRAARSADGRVEKTFTVAAMGPVGHVYFAEPKTDDEQLTAWRNVSSAGVHSRRAAACSVQATAQSRGSMRKAGRALPDEVPPMLPHPPRVRVEIARDLVTFCANPNSWRSRAPGLEHLRPGVWSFLRRNVGAHGGFRSQRVAGFRAAPGQHAACRRWEPRTSSARARCAPGALPYRPVVIRRVPHIRLAAHAPAK